MNFKSNKGKSTFLNLRKYFSVVLVLYLWGIIPQLNATVYSAPPENQKIVKGIVVDEMNEPMLGVNVIEKGTTNGSITDLNGRFQLKVSGTTSKLVFSYIGYTVTEVNVGNGDLKVQMKPATEFIDEVVVVGYAKQKKESVVGSIAQVSGDALKSKGGVTNITNALSGSMPGVTIMTSAGNPGGGGAMGSNPDILIRGMNTWNNAQPLILVDGVERSMGDIDVNEVASFSVLKDASATAVFGVRGGNGVILINTKQGTTGKPKINIEINSAFKTISKVEKVLGSYDALIARNYGLVNELPLSIAQANWATYYTNARILGYYKDQTDPEKYADIDWQDYMMRPYANTTKYAINISGGTDFMKYFTSLAYTSDGDVLNTVSSPKGYSPEFSYKRYNFRTNLDFKITKTTQFKVNLSGFYGVQQEPAIGVSNVWFGVYKHSPTAVPLYSDGLFGSDETSSDRFGINSYKEIETNGNRSNGRTSFTTDFELNQDLNFITKGLTFKGKFSFDNYYATTGRSINDNQGYYTKRFDVPSNQWQYTAPTLGSDGFDIFSTPLGYGAESILTADANKTQRHIYYECALNYDRKFGDHSLGLLAVFSRQEGATGNDWPTKREDWVGRITYNYQSKYMLEVNGCYNGSDLFGPANRFAFFPSLALGWRVSEEKFIKDYIPQISNFKLRYSLGLIGSDNLSGIQWGWKTTWNPFLGSSVSLPNTKSNDAYPQFGYPYSAYSSYYSDPTKDPRPAYMEGVPGNPDLGWEKSKKQNIGADISLFDDLITGTADFFTEDRTDMLMAAADRTAVSDLLGQNPSPANLGRIKSHGVELEMKVQKKFGKVQLWASYNWTEAVNKIIFKEDPELAPNYQKKAGYAIGQNTSFVNNGIIQSWDQMYTGVMYDGTSGVNANIIPGDFRMIDFNSNGVIDKYDGAPNNYALYPENTYGFSFGGDYAGFSLMVQFYGNYNVSANEGALQEFDYSAPIIYQSLLNRSFQPEYGNASPDYRSLSIKRGSPSGNSMIYDASFLRLKTFEISYTFPKKIAKSLLAENVRIYTNGNNLFYWSKLPIDVEGKNAVVGNGTYPTTKSVNFGLNITF